MKFIALLLGLAIERLFTNLFKPGELRLLDRYFDVGLGLVERVRGWPGVLCAALVVLLPAAPVAAIAVVFQDVLFGAPYVAFAILVLLFSLGPRDLGVEVDDFVAASRRGDEAMANHVARELLETKPPSDTFRRTLAIEEAIFVQSNNRTFGVLLWFVLLGPAGAWLFRVTDMFRRRAFFEAERLRESGGERPQYVTPVQRLHGLLAWLPSRVVALSYALAGSFEPAVEDWRNYYRDCSEHFFEVNDEIVATAGLGALGKPPSGPELLAADGAVSAMRLVNRSLLIWLVAVALLTVVGAAV